MNYLRKLFQINSSFSSSGVQTEFVVGGLNSALNITVDHCQNSSLIIAYYGQRVNLAFDLFKKGEFKNCNILMNFDNHSYEKE